MHVRNEIFILMMKNQVLQVEKEEGDPKSK
jgi:hypothetical protein